MCGVAGIVNLDGGPVDRAELETLSRALAHRGPDGDGVHIAGNVGVAHRRLAIIDPTAGQQPLLSADGQLAISYNGEIYNFVELRRELAEFEFHTNCDTEVVLRAYEKWGIGCLEKFQGMFAFALLDKRSQRLFLVRDRVGIKPLYVQRNAQRLRFASELRALSRDESSRDIDPESVAHFFRLQYVPAPSTIYRDTRKLEAGHYLEIGLADGSVTDRCWWKLAIRPRAGSEKAWREELDALLDDIMRIYVRSDVPFGAFLSGGVDSSLVTALMARVLDKPVRTFAIGFDEREHSELPYAAEASRVVGTKHQERVVTPSLAEDVLAKLVSHFGEPFGDSSAIPSYYVAREAAAEVKMVLSGDGGDELFAGYDSYQSTWRQTHGPRKVLRAALGPVAALAGRPLARLQDLHDAQREAFAEDELDEFLVPDVPRPGPPAFDVESDGEVDPVTWFQAQDFKTYLVDDVLTKVDRMSMACSLEVRVPLLDHKLVELAFALPVDLKIRPDRGGALETKYLLRRSAERFYSREFLARPKRGFGIPIVEWCRGPFRPMLERAMSESGNPIFQFVRADAARLLVRQFLEGNDALVARIWYLLAFDLWFRHVQRPN